MTARRFFTIAYTMLLDSAVTPDARNEIIDMLAWDVVVETGDDDDTKLQRRIATARAAGGEVEVV